MIDTMIDSNSRHWFKTSFGGRCQKAMLGVCDRQCVCVWREGGGVESVHVVMPCCHDCWTGFGEPVLLCCDISLKNVSHNHLIRQANTSENQLKYAGIFPVCFRCGSPLEDWLRDAWMFSVMLQLL